MIYPATIGIVGGGQLGKMLVLAAKKMGFMVIVTDPTPQSPAGQVADRELTGDYKDEKVTRKLAKLSDVITIDAELTDEDLDASNIVNIRAWYGTREDALVKTSKFSVDLEVVEGFSLGTAGVVLLYAVIILLFFLMRKKKRKH